MKLILTLIALTIAVPCYAGDIDRIIFAQSSSAKTSTPNLRVSIMTGALKKDWNIVPIQAFSLETSTTYNYYLTKSTTFTVPANAIAVRIETDNDTRMTVNNETAYKLLMGGSYETFAVK